MQFLWAPSMTISQNFQKDVKCTATKENCAEGKLKKKIYIYIYIYIFKEFLFL